MISRSLPLCLWHPDPLGAAHRHGVDGETTGRMFDVCILGSGASGAVVADALVAAGLDVLMLEEGGRVAPTVSYDALEAATPKAFVADRAGRPVERGWPWTTRNLGGGTVFYGGASFRYQPFDFDPTDRIHVAGLDLRWPFGLDELRPYYERIERRLGVSGGDPREADGGARGRAHPRSQAGERLWRAACDAGYHPFPTPLAIRAEAGEHQHACHRESLCITYACRIGAKADAVSTFLLPIASAPNFTLRTGVRAVRLDQVRGSAVDRVVGLDMRTGARIEYRARLFVLACNAIQTAALLLRSRTEFAPEGIGNDHGMVGRGLCMKLSEYTTAELDRDAAEGPIVTNGPFSTVAITDHYLDPDCPTGVGGLIYEAKADHPAAYPRDRVQIRIETILSDHPSITNRVRLVEQSDEFGIPRLAIDYQTDPRDAARLRYMLDRSRALIVACGATDVRTEPSGYARGSTHLHGTCRSGRDPRTSVVDGESRIHAIDNAYVADGSFMPYPGGLNPTLTIQAHALRTAEIIARRA
jgi:choline dehydrogenase-like flavoprotein